MTHPAHEHGSPYDPNRAEKVESFHRDQLPSQHSDILKSPDATEKPRRQDEIVASELGSLGTSLAQTETSDFIAVHPRAALTQEAPYRGDLSESEDAVFVSPRGDFGVFDGLGDPNLPNSRQASNLAKNILSEYLYSLDHTIEPEYAVDYVRRGIKKVHEVIASTMPNQGATTASVGTLIEHAGKKYLVYASVGDSRIEVYRPGRHGQPGVLRHVTHDELSANEQLTFNATEQRQLTFDNVRTRADYNKLSQEDKWAFDHKNFIYAALGDALPPTIQAGCREVEPGDLVLAYTDSVPDNLTAAERREIMDITTGNNATVAGSIRMLHAQARNKMQYKKDENDIRPSPDDTTVVAVEVV